MPALFNATAARWTGLAAVAAFAVLTLAAIAVRPDYNAFAGFFSELGVGAGAAFFNSAVGLGGLLALAFHAVLFALARSGAGKLGAALGAVAAVFLAGVGAFPMNAPEHVPVAAGFFLAAGASALLLAWAEGFPRWVRGAGFVAAVLIGVRLAFESGSLQTLAVLAYGAWVAGAALNAEKLGGGRA